MKNITREQWLEGAVKLMTPLFKKHDYKVPALRVTCGWPSKGGVARKSITIGQCWDKAASSDKKHQIFISPRLVKASEKQGVLPTLVHEVVHAVVGIKERHNSVFGACARAVGLEGKLTATHASKELVANCKKWAAKLGKYPHAQLNPKMSPVKTQGTRLLKCECGECGCVVRITRKWLEEVGAPLCACNSEAMKEAK